MSWETRKGTGRYYTRTFRVNGRLVREYVGTGQVGRLAAQEDRTKQEQRQIEREVQREETERHAAIWEVLRTLGALSSLSLKQALESAGYHSHKGQWRKQRVEVNAVSEEHPVPRQALDLQAMSEAHPVSGHAPDLRAAKEIMEAVQKHRPGAIPAFQALMKKLPELPAIHGDLSRLAENSLLYLTAGDDDLELEMRRAWLAQTREKLAEPGDGELERQLIHRLSLNLLAVSYAEARRAQLWRAGCWSEAQATAWDRRVSTYQNELFRASRALRESRRLARPIVLAQMNIAQKQQINITAANPPIEAAERE